MWMVIQMKSWMVRVDCPKRFCIIGIKSSRKGVIRGEVGEPGDKSKVLSTDEHAVYVTLKSQCSILYAAWHHWTFSSKVLSWICMLVG